jgi:hypothetical protein
LRVVEVGFCRIQRSLIALNLRVDSANLRLFYCQRRCCGIQILLRYRLRFSQRLLTGQRDLSKITLRQAWLRCARNSISVASTSRIWFSACSGSITPSS